MSIEKYIHINEVCERLGMSRQAVLDRIKRGTLPAGELINYHRMWIREEMEPHIHRVTLERAVRKAMKPNNPAE